MWYKVVKVALLEVDREKEREMEHDNTYIQRQMTRIWGIFVEDHIKFWTSHNFLIPDSIIQIFKWSFNSTRLNDWMMEFQKKYPYVYTSKQILKMKSPFVSISTLGRIENYHKLCNIFSVGLVVLMENSSSMY